ncbi:MAG: hypothetical protein Q4P84_09410, partial [Elusimicrobiales bacterium]|nr:hypothetical protein [Elusimicrobiales bacterium]
MKKVLLAVLAGAMCLPAFAKDVKCDGDKCPMKRARMEMTDNHRKGKDARADAFKKARKEHKAKMKATEAKMEKLVEEYNKMKP